MRRIPTLALAAAAAAALPARADYPPTDCAAYLVLAANGRSTGCDTIGTTAVLGGDHRVLNVSVQTGQVSATLGCGADGWHSTSEIKTIVVTAPWSGSTVVERTGYCWVTLTALTDGTTAVATNTTGRTANVAH